MPDNKRYIESARTFTQKKIRRYIYQNYEARAGEIKVLPFVEYGEIKVRFKQGTKETMELLSAIERL